MPSLCDGRILKVPVGASGGGDVNIVSHQLLAFVIFGPVSVISEEVALKRGFEQSVESLNIMTIARDLDSGRDASLRGKNEMFANADEPPF